MTYNTKNSIAPKSILKAALIASLCFGFSYNAFAEDVIAPEISYLDALTSVSAPALSQDSVIAVARLDGGRLIPTPHTELEDWSYLDNRSPVNFVPMKAASYIKYTPEIPFNGKDTDNKIDEVRLTAANEGINFTLIYAVGPDADFALFGHRTMTETGLILGKTSDQWTKAKSRALLMNSHNGQVLGMVSADNVEFNIGELADKVGDMVNRLSVVKLASRTTISG
ncbi:MAG: hypothetical protein ABJ275_08660 [Maricaulaceae bacterium]